jgi:hypothetical protein
MSLSGAKAHPLWYADLGREAKKGIVAETASAECQRRLP